MGARTLSDRLRDSARDGPERIAIGRADGALTLSYRDLEVLADELATELHRRGVGASDTVAIASDNCVELAVALFAIWATGAAAAPLDPALTPPEIASKLDAVEAKAMLVPAHLTDAFAPPAGRAPPLWSLSLEGSTDRRRPVLSGDAPAAGVSRADARGPREGDVALELFTTGTTSRPKVVPLTHANVVASIDGGCATYRLSPDDVTLLVMPLFHGHGLIGGLLATLASGGAAYLPTLGRFSASSFWAQMSGVRATWYTAVPTIHQILLERAAAEYPRDRPPPLRFVRSCSAPIAPDVLRAVASTFRAPVIPAYGMTETAHQATSNPLPTLGRCEASSVGVPTGLELQIVGEDGRVVPRGGVGEIRVRGPALTSGYLHAPEENAASFVDGWFRTGDLGYQDDDGYLFLRGRIKELINRGGEKISPYSVDAVLTSNPKVEDAMSFGVPDAKYGEEIVAAIVLRPGERATERELETYARARLSAFEAPKRLYFVESLPRTAKGAGDRRRLAAMFGGASSQAQGRTR